MKISNVHFLVPKKNIKKLVALSAASFIAAAPLCAQTQKGEQTKSDTVTITESSDLSNKNNILKNILCTIAVIAGEAVITTAYSDKIKEMFNNKKD